MTRCSVCVGDCWTYGRKSRRLSKIGHMQEDSYHVVSKVVRKRLGIWLEGASKVDQTLPMRRWMRWELGRDALLQFADGGGLGDAGEEETVPELIRRTGDPDIHELTAPCHLCW